MGKNTLFLTKISIKLLNFNKKEEKMGELEEKILYVGIDSSNNGRPNEVFVAVFSEDSKLITPHQNHIKCSECSKLFEKGKIDLEEILQKEKTELKNFAQKDYEIKLNQLKKFYSKKRRIKSAQNIIGGEYSFLSLTKEQKEKINSKYLLGIVVSSLIQDVNAKNFEKILIFVMGDWKNQSFSNIFTDRYKKKMYSEQDIIIQFGSGFDKEYKLVNLADYQANYLFGCGIKTLCKHPNKKEVIFE